eukprot:12953940-Ditylum_brightwellii.AAC.2
MTMNKNKNGGSNMNSIIAQEEAEVDHFCWGNSKDHKVELMKGVKKEEGKEKWNQEEKSRQEKDCNRKNSIKQRNANKTELDNGNRPDK